MAPKPKAPQAPKPKPKAKAKPKARALTEEERDLRDLLEAIRNSTHEFLYCPKGVWHTER